MPCAHEFATEHDLIVMRCWGKVTMQELRSTFVAAVHDPNYRYGMSEFGDFSGVTSVDLGFPEMMALAERFRAGYERSRNVAKVAYFAPGDIAFGMTRMFQTLTSDVENLDLGLFRTLEPALEHLGINHPGMSARLKLAGAA